MTRRGRGKSSKADNSASPRSGYGSDVVWFNPQPNNTDAARLDSEPENYGPWVVSLIEGMSDRHRISCKFDDKSSRWVAVLFVDPVEQGEPVQALSVRGASAFFALVLLGYFHCVRFSDGWEQAPVEIPDKFG